MPHSSSYPASRGKERSTHRRCLNDVDYGKSIALDLYQEIDSAVSLSCYLLLKYNQLETLVAKEISADDYNDADSFRRDLLAVSFLRKQRWMPTGIPREEEAFQKWISNENSNSATNQRLRQRSDHRMVHRLFQAKDLIQSVIGLSPPDWWLSEVRWGPGSTATLRGSESTVVHKIGSCPISVTRRALPYLKAAIRDDFHWLSAILKTDVVGPCCLLDDCFELTEANRAVLVEKDAKSLRSIAAEPTGNIFLQLGVGSVIRSKLKRVGIDLDDQTLNQTAARAAYDSGLATLDLSSASDTLCTELVKLLLPVGWYGLLSDLRVPMTSWSVGTFRLEKFSSMGNGFTFELESLIFWALAKAVSGTKQVHVYGDDIVCHKDAVAELVALLSYVGFQVNSRKSHYEGCYYESCGKHYFKGNDVTPVHQKENPGLNLFQAIRCYNRLASWFYCDFPSVFQRITRPWIELGPIPQVPFGTEGDGGFWTYFYQELSTGDRGGGFLRFDTLQFRSSVFKTDSTALLAYKLRFPSDVALGGRLPLRRHGKYLRRGQWISTDPFANPYLT